MSDLNELQLRLAELVRLRDEYAARPGRSTMARYVDTLIAGLESEIAEAPRSADADPELPLPPMKS